MRRGGGGASIRGRPVARAGATRGAIFLTILNPAGAGPLPYIIGCDKKKYVKRAKQNIIALVMCNLNG
jgi:hypothetical protein